MAKKEPKNKDILHRKGDLPFFFRMELLSFFLSGLFFVAGFVLIITYFYLKDVVILLYLSFLFFTLFFVTFVLRFLYERRLLKEVTTTEDIISSQLESYAKGSFTLERRHFHSHIARSLLARFNDTLSSFSAVLTKTEKESKEVATVVDEILTREAFEKACAERGIEFFLPPPILCTDNAAMIGSAAFFEYLYPSSKSKFTIMPSLHRIP